MRIKKISPTTPANGNIENQYGTSQTNAYSEEYSNNTFATKDVATTSANGLMSSSDKSKLDDITNTTNWTLLDNTVYYRKVGNIVTIRGYSTGTVSLTANDYKNLATLPSSARPGIDLGFPFTRIGGTDVPGIVRLTASNGKIDVFSTTAGSYWAFTMTYII